MKLEIKRTKINYTSCCKLYCEHKAKYLTKKQVEDGRSNSYKYLNL